MVDFKEIEWLKFAVAVGVIIVAGLLMYAIASAVFQSCSLEHDHAYGVLAGIAIVEVPIFMLAAYLLGHLKLQWLHNWLTI